MNQETSQKHVVRSRARARSEASSVQTVNGGQERLRSLDLPLNDIATECGVSKALVSNWRTGLRLPSPDARERLELAYGIPQDEWDVRHVDESAPVADAVELDPDAPPLESTLRMLDQQLMRLANGGTDEDFKQAEGIRKMLATRAQQEKDKRTIDAYIERAVINPTRQPFYQRTVNLVVDALKPHPDALRDVLAALDAAAEEGDS